MPESSVDAAIAEAQLHRPYDQVRATVRSYLEDPASVADPIPVVNGYFHDRRLENGWTPELGDQAEELMTAMKTKLESGRNPELDRRHGNVGSVVMDLPYYYPLDLTVLGWYLGGEIERASSLSQEQKDALAIRLQEKADLYDPLGADKDRNVRKINMLQPRTTQSAPPKPGIFQRMNPFKK